MNLFDFVKLTNCYVNPDLDFKKNWSAIEIAATSFDFEKKLYEFCEGICNGEFIRRSVCQVCVDESGGMP